MTIQPDFFDKQIGFDLGDAPAGKPVSAHSVRLELTAILETAKAARESAPWDRRTHQYHQVVFPQMANWLPPEEAEFMRRQFELELVRIEKLLAA